MTDVEQFRDVVDLLEGEGYNIVSKKFKSKEWDDEFEAQFYIESRD